MKLKKFLIVSAIALTTGTLASCGGDGGEMDVGEDGQITFRNVELMFTHVISGTDSDYIVDLVNQFNEEYDGQIYVNAASGQATDVYNGLPVSTSSNTNSDVMLIHAERVLQFAAQKDSDGTSRYFRELEDVMETADLTLDPNDFPKGVWDNMSYDGHQYGIPFDMHMAGIYVNTDILDELNLDMPTNREEIIEAAQLAIEHGYQGFPISTGYPDTYFYLNGFFNYGGKQMVTEGEDGFDPNLEVNGQKMEIQPGVYYNDAAKKTTEFMNELFFDYEISDSQLPTDAGIGAFRRGEALFTMDGIWLLNDVIRSASSAGFNFDVIPASTLYDGEDNPDFTNQVYTNGHIFVLPKHTLNGDDDKYQIASMVFVKWMLEHSTDWAKSGKVAAYAPARETEEYKAIPYLDGFGEIDNFVAWYPHEYAYVGFSPSQQITTQVLNSTTKCTEQQIDGWVEEYYQECLDFIRSAMTAAN